MTWYRDGAYTPDHEGRFDVGGTTSEALGSIEAGTPAGEAGPSGEYDGGNGSLMRILPIALVGRGLDASTLVDQAMRAFGCGFRRVELKVDVRNARSQAAMAKLGAVREGVIRADRVTWTGHVRDTVLFSILANEWPPATEQPVFQAKPER